jgi:hypothetical protein
MEELATLVSNKTGISQDQARQAVQVVMDYLTTHLPAPVATQVQAVLAGGNLGDLAKGLGGLFGNK